jgi:hypothetical protein
MGYLVLIALMLVIWAALKHGRLKLVLSAEESARIRAAWWAEAKRELKIWAIVFVILCAIFGDPLLRAHWNIGIYVLIVWGSLVLFSRLAIWATVGIISCTLLLGSIVEFFWRFPCPVWLVALGVMVGYAVFIRFILLVLRRTFCRVSRSRPPSLPHESAKESAADR